MTFINPYHFVPTMDKPLDAKCSKQVSQTLVQKPEKKEAFQPNLPEMLHDRYQRVPGDQSSEDPSSATPTYSGRIICQLTTKSPCVFGNLHRKVKLSQADESDKPEHTTIVDNFSIAGHAAIAGTTLKGMLSTLAEMASGSAMRVLRNRAMSIRSTMHESRSAMGVIVKREGRRFVIPLVLPTFSYSDEFKCFVPTDNTSLSAWNTICEQMRAAAGLHMTATYVNKKTAYEYSYGYKNQVASLPNKDLFNVRWHHSHNAPEGYKSAPDASPGDKVAKLTRDRKWVNLIRPAKSSPLPEVQPYQADDGDAQPGIVRILTAPALSNRDSGSRPAKSTFAMFIPISPSWIGSHDQLDVARIDDRVPHLDAEQACAAFDTIVGDSASTAPPERSATPLHDQRAFKLPNGSATATDSKLREGDLVCFRLKSVTEVDSVSISSIWREGVRWLWKSENDHVLGHYEMRPMDSKRKTISMAERMFGWVMDEEKGEIASKDSSTTNEDSSDSGKTSIPSAYKGRIRISDAISPSKLAEAEMPPNPKTVSDSPTTSTLPKELHGRYPLRILGSPKLPCPEFYFTNAPGDVRKDLFDQDKEVRMQGWKFYVLDQRTLDNSDSETWTTKNWDGNDKDANLQQKTWVRPIDKNTEFSFHIEFDQLTANELALLCYTLTPAEESTATPKTTEFFHRLGLAKPLGLGVVRITPMSILYIDRQTRYKKDAHLLTSASRYTSYRKSRAIESEAHQVIVDGDYRSVEKQRAEDEASPQSAEHSIEEWAHQHRERLNNQCPLQHESIVAMGTPPKLPDGCIGVSYPVLDNQDGESMLYKWFVANRDPKKTTHAQSLEPMRTDYGQVTGPRPPEVKWKVAVNQLIPDDTKQTIVNVINEIAQEYGHRVVIAKADPTDAGPVIPTSGDYNLYFGFPDINDRSCNYLIREPIDKTHLKRWLLRHLGNYTR